VLNREQRRRPGKRESRRGAIKDIGRVLELGAEGRSTSAIASSLRLPVELVDEILNAARKQEGAGGSHDL
jgi:hypothetical protein